MKRRFWRRFGNELGLLALLAGLFVFFSILNSAFFRLGNLQQLLTQMVELGFVTLGMSICVISGGFDLSIGTLTSLCTVALALLLTNGVNMWLCLVLVLAMSLLCGALNGLLIGYLNIQPILVTLGTSSVFTGIAVLLSRARHLRPARGIPGVRFPLFGRGAAAIGAAVCGGFVFPLFVPWYPLGAGGLSVGV